MTPISMMDQMLRRIYYDVNSPASFSSVDRLYREARTRSASVTRTDVENFLAGELTYTLHRQRRHRFHRNPVVSNFHSELAQADLIDVSKYSESNNDCKFILTMIDVFSKIAFAVPIKRKTGRNVCKAMSAIFKSYVPNMLQTDEGKEFTNKFVQKILKHHNVHFYLAKNERIKCAVIERFQRTFLSRLHKYFTSQGTQSYLDVIQSLIDSYNNSFHRSIKMTPTQAVAADSSVLFKNLYGADNERQLLKKASKMKTKLQPGDHIRVPEHKNAFAKGYQQNFGDTIYKVKAVNLSHSTPRFVIEDYDGKRVPGTFYAQEAQKVSRSHVYRVAVLAERVRGRGKQYLVRYVNHPDTPDEWIAGSRLAAIDGGAH